MKGTTLDHKDITLSEKSQREKDKYGMVPLTCGIFKKENS